MDETYVGGKTRGKGKGTHDMAVVVGAVEIRTSAEEEAAKRWSHSYARPKKGKTYAGRLRLKEIPNRGAKALRAVHDREHRTRGVRHHGRLARL